MGSLLLTHPCNFRLLEVGEWHSKPLNGQPRFVLQSDRDQTKASCDVKTGSQRIRNILDRVCKAATRESDVELVPLRLDERVFMGPIDWGYG